MACSTGCPTQDHTSWGECVRGKRLRTAYMQDHAGKDATAQKRADRNLDDYAKARAYGIQPTSTRPADVQRAIRHSDKTGEAFTA